MQHHVAGPLS
jgi:hypothetical protein